MLNITSLDIDSAGRQQLCESVELIVGEDIIIIGQSKEYNV
jgi:hypothetical protein